MVEPPMADRLEALERPGQGAAWSTPGIANVLNELEVAG